MEERRARTVSRGARVTAALVVSVFLTAGCAGRHSGPRSLAALGGLGVVGGSVAWAVGEGTGPNGGAANGAVTAGFVTVAAGIAAIVIAGGWMAMAVSCDGDPDCDEEEQCREIPAPPGGIPYKQCMGR